MRQITIEFTFLIPTPSGCAPIPRPVSPSPASASGRETAMPGATPALHTTPTRTDTPDPSPTVTASQETYRVPTETVFDLEILEWSEYPPPNLVEPQNRSTFLWGTGSQKRFD